MRLLIITLLSIATALNISAQRNVNLIADYNRTEFDDKTLNGLNAGLEFKNTWQLTFDFNSGKSLTNNLPSNYSGPDLIATMESRSINLGRKFFVFPENKVWLNTKVGIHKTNYKDFQDFKFIPRPEYDDSNHTGIDLIDAFIVAVDVINDDYVSHSYEIVDTEHLGFNGQVMLEGLLHKNMTWGIGSKLIYNKRNQEASFLIKVGFRF